MIYEITKLEKIDKLWCWEIQGPNDLKIVGQRKCSKKEIDERLKWFVDRMQEVGRHGSPCWEVWRE